MVAVLAVIGLSVHGADAMISCVAAVDFGTSRHAGTAAGFINCCGSVGAILGGLLPGYVGTSALFYGSRRGRVPRDAAADPALEPDAGSGLIRRCRCPLRPEARSGHRSSWH